MHTEEQLDDREFEKMLMEKNHKELMASIKAMTVALERNDQSNKEISKIVAASSKVFDSFLSKLNEISQPMASPNVVVNQDSVVAELVKMTSELKAKFCSPTEEKPKQWSFEVLRNSAGVITNINAKQK
jgi:hypothetical protein